MKMGHTVPGPLCTSKVGSSWVDSGTLALTRNVVPAPAGSASRLTISGGEIERLTAAIERSIPLLPAEVRGKFVALLTPSTFAALVAVLAIWGASHFIGIGEAVDVLLLGVGIVAFSREAIDIGRRFAAFARLATTASTEADIDRAAQQFASAISAVGVDSLIVIVTHRVVSGARVATEGIAASARVTSAAERLQLLVDDEGKVLQRLVQGARNPADKEELLAWLQRLEKQIPNFKGRPKLRVTAADERWSRASDTFDEAGVKGDVRERATGRKLMARDDGAYLAVSADRKSSAVLSSWNRMNVVEEQVVPKGSIVLDGPAAAQAAPAAAWSKAGEHLSGGGRQIFHGGQMGSDGKLSTAVRTTSGGYAVRPDGTALPDM
jgi:hypothetical protein